ncbi:MAG: MMPL family transporter [Clostridia bacterium]|nr:MMPL family transporter [Clostridia bacterium]
MTLVPVKYNLTEYLPDKAASTVALKTMNEEFTGAIDNARVLVPNVSVQEALVYKSAIAEIDGVAGVTWLDDNVKITEPLETIDQAMIEEYYKDECAIMSVIIESGKEVVAINAIRELVGEEGAVTGEAAGSAQSQESASSEAIQIISLLIPLLIVILLCSTNSYFEPFVLLIGIGVSVLINMGTNIFLGSISYITSSVAPILQLAVSLDYAIFLLHSFASNRKKTPDIEQAMKAAIKESFPAVSASALTTLFGFLVLCFMRFKIGIDMGLTLAKGIALSLTSCMVFLPAFTLICCPLLDKTTHKSFMPSFRKVGVFATKIRIVAFIAVLVLIIPCFMAQNKINFTYGTGEVDATSRAGRDSMLIESKFGQSSPIVILVPRGNAAKEDRLTRELQDLDAVTSVISYASMAGIEIPTDYLEPETLALLYSDAYSRIIIYADIPTEGTEAFTFVERIRALADKYYPGEALSCGESVNIYDMKDIITNDNTLVNVLAIIAIGIILLFTFKSLSLPIMLILTIESGIWINLSIPYFTGSVVCYIGYLVINTVQLGATVDYAILFTDNYLKNRKKAFPVTACVMTISETLPSILVSGLILTGAGFLVGFVSANGVVSQLGTLLGRGAFMSMCVVLFFLPAALTLFDRFIGKTTFNSRFLKKERRRRNEKQA